MLHIDRWRRKGYESEDSSMNILGIINIIFKPTSFSKHKNTNL
jgi:hypothetical protein